MRLHLVRRLLQELVYREVSTNRETGKREGEAVLAFYCESQVVLVVLMS